MVVKKYSPIRVQNPSSHQHVVRVNPGQQILLCVSNDPDIQINSEYMKIESCEISEDGRVYVISHNVNVYDWSLYSQVVLGKIWIDYDKSISKLSVVMECNNYHKLNFVTLINPDGYDLRIKPHNIIEVILYDLSFGFRDKWCCDWISNINNLGIEEIGLDYLCLQSWNSCGLVKASYPYAKYPRVDVSKNSWVRQHHFWFRFDSSLNSIVQEIKGGIEHVGKLTFWGKSNDHLSLTQSYSVNIFLDCRVLKPQLFVDTSSLKTKDKYPPYLFDSLESKKQNFIPIVRDVDVLVVGQSFEGCRVADAIEPFDSHQEFKEGFYDFPFVREGNFPRCV